MRAVLVALREGQGIVQPGAPSLPRKILLNNPPLPSFTPFNSREWESHSTTFLRESAYEEVDVLDDLKKYPTKPDFEERNCKPKEIMSFISISLSKIQGCGQDQSHGDVSSRQGLCLVQYFEEESRELWDGTYLNMECFQGIVFSIIPP